MMVLVFGLEGEDAILQRLRKMFPDVGFKKHASSDDLEEEGRDLVVLDTVEGAESVVLIEDLNSISPGKALKGSETLMTLRIMKSIGSFDSVKVIAVPPGFGVEEAVEGIGKILGEIKGN
ncbi:MAG: hypothetical protein AB1324_08080 [Candidatus Micrarchaeota archaeon]